MLRSIISTAGAWSCASADVSMARTVKFTAGMAADDLRPEAVDCMAEMRMSMTWSADKETSTDGEAVTMAVALPSFDYHIREQVRGPYYE